MKTTNPGFSSRRPRLASKKRARPALAAAVLAGLASTGLAGTIGFEEDYALAPDRAAALKQLIPGTADFYYYNTLTFQNAGDYPKAQEMVDAWAGRIDINGDPRLVEMQNRQALFTYDKDGQKSLDFISHRLGLTFSHERESLDQQRSLPTSLNQSLFSRQALTQRFFAQNIDNLQGFEDSGLDSLDTGSLSPNRLREYLSRLQRPDVPNLPALIDRDLGNGTYYSFTLPITHQLLLSQLDELLRLRPTLLNDTNFVNIYLVRLRPADGVDWQHDPREQAAYLDRLWAFASRLGPAHNSLKANILYQRLVFDRTQGVWDKNRFMDYIQLPRNVSYINPLWRNTPRAWDNPVDLNADFSASIIYRPIMNDEALVRSYLLHFFPDAADYDAYRPFIDNDYLEHAFAEAKITNGIGSLEKWAAELPPAMYQALKDRIDVDFDYTNKQSYAPADKVSLDIYTKNVKTLLVKVYDINTPSFYKNNLRELGTDIPLDGLVANDESVMTYDDPPLRRVAHHFDFPKLTGRGAYIIEFIGNGISSRALVIKGKLHYLEEHGSAGHEFTVLDESNNKVADASIWMADHEYTANKDGTILVPYSTAPGMQPILLQVGDFASFDSFDHRAEEYSFKAAFHVDREELIRGGKATVIIRPTISINGEPASLRLTDDPSFEKPILTITSVDREGTPTTKEIPDFPLLLDRETTYDFQVPDNLSSVTFSLRAHVKDISTNKPLDLADGRTFAVNAIDTSDKIEDLFLTHADGQYYVDVLGKSCEAIADHPVNVSLKHKDFREPVPVTLKSDAKGRIALGELVDIASFTASTNEGVTHTWTPVKDAHTPVPTAYVAAGAPVLLPYMGKMAVPSTAEVSLLELRGGTFYADRFNAISIKDGLLNIDGLPQGDYSLRYKDTGEMVSIRIAPGETRDGWVLSKSRFLEQHDPAPLQVASVTSDAQNVTVKLVNTTKLTRVHVFVTRYVPDVSPYASLGAVPSPGDVGMTLPVLDAQYVAGRNIGDEYRYILDRKYAKLFPGNMLDRPDLLLNPWSVSKTDTGQQLAQAGESPRGAPAVGGTGMLGNTPALAPPPPPATGSFSSYDFLPSESVLMANLLPDDKGVITIPRSKLGDHQEIHVVAVDVGVTVYRELSLPEVALVPRDLRLKSSLDVAKHFTEQKQIAILPKGAAYSSDDAASAALESYDSIGRVYKLYATLSHDPTLAEFAFITDWPKLTQAQKQEKYSKYACHELNFFLSRKDPAFFNSVIKPYIQNKKDKTFMDHYLLGDDLTVYLKPSEYERLNIAEQALLAERIANEQPITARHIKDRYDLLPPDIEHFNELFRTALQGGALDQNNKLASSSVAYAIQGGNDFSGGANREVAGQLMDRRGATFAGGIGGRGGGGGFGGGANGPTAAAAPSTQPAVEMQRAAAEGKSTAAMEEDEKSLLGAAKDKAYDRMDQARKATEDLSFRDQIHALYVKLDKTEEWAENNYYHVPIEQQSAALIPVSAFWRDYAQTPAKASFLTTNIAEAGRNFSEMMLALGVLDLPFESPALDVARKDGKLSFTAPGPMVVFHKQIDEATIDPAKTPILVSQNFFRASDRYTYVDNERADKYVADEFLTHVVYGCQIVVTNPTSSRQKLDVLLQVPAGAIPVSNGLYTHGIHADLNPFESRAIEYYFYFPSPGSFSHYPVHVAKNEKVIAYTPASTFKVVNTPSKIDKASWDYISQNGTNDQVLQYLRDNNIDRLNLDRIAWRMKDPEYFSKVIDLLSQRHVYNDTLWSYGLKDNNVPAIREYLQHAPLAAGAYIDTKLLTLDPVERRTYQFLEYMPLVNARAHKMGRERQIVNDKEYQQYERLLGVERYRPKMDNDDLMSITYYLLLQDRVDEAQSFFKQVDAPALTTQLQYDYARAYMDFFTDTPEQARSIVDKYKTYPVDRWRKLFAGVGAELDELSTKSPGGTNIVNTDDRNQQNTALASQAPNLDFKVDGRKVTLNYQNLGAVKVNYYLMDIELMFSQNPFLGHFSGQFSSILPNETDTVKLDAAKSSTTFDLPERFQNSNVMIEITDGAITRTQAYYPNSLNLQMVETYGQVHVTDDKSGDPLPKVYVKVYARMKDGRTEFYKDGYTDLRGRFEYASLSTNDLDNVDRFAILVLSDAQGAVVREAPPPKQ